MNIEIILSLITAFFGGSVVSGIIVWKTRKAMVKSADAKATTDVAESLKLTGEVYTFLTAITKQELQEMRDEIKKVKKDFADYRRECGDCPNSTKKK